MLQINKRAPRFNLADQNGKFHKLEDYKNKFVLLYFYPKDDTPGCTKEACAFRDNIKEIEKLNTVVFGISKDSVVSHKKFAEKYYLNFSILADEKKETIEAYEAKTPLGTLRVSYLIGKNGKIAKTYPNVNPITHPTQIINDIKKANWGI